MWSILALGAVERLIHHCINLDAITRIQFNELQDKMLRVEIDSPELSLAVCFDHAKIRLEPTVTGHTEAASIFEQRPFDSVNTITEANATLHVDNVIELAKLLLADDVGNIPVQGEYQLLQNIQCIIQQAEPDLASQLSPWIGPNLASQIGKTQLAPKQLFKAFDSHLFVAEDFLKEDSGLFAPRWQMDDLNHETRQLTQNIYRLEAKIQQLESQFNPT